MNREESLKRILDREDAWDIAVVGGGATGVGIALDAAARGYSVCLFEQSDFGEGTSSRSTKIVHGGVRYLAQGNIMLVMEGLKERGIMRRIAPHLVRNLSFIVPSYTWWDIFFYGIGLKVYDFLALWYGFGRSLILSKKEALGLIPTLKQEGLRGGILYHDGQFDDTRMLVSLAQTATEQGASLLNYARVTEVTHDDTGKADGLVFADAESGQTHRVKARCVVNATGPFSDVVRTEDDSNAKPILAPSQGVHLIVGASFLPGNTAIMVPKTADGRVMFAVPWNGRTILGTTDTPIKKVSPEPHPLEGEIDFILKTSAPYFAKPPTRADILAVFTGIRPLVGSIGKGSTAVISRDFMVRAEPSGMLTVAGGKWTIYRKMAESCVDKAIDIAGLERRPSPTKTLHIHGYIEGADASDLFSWYGSDAKVLKDLMKAEPRLGERLHERLPLFSVQVVWAARHEMARTVEDVLSRRTRALLEDEKAAVEVAPRVARLLAEEFGKDEAWQTEQVRQFSKVAETYSATPSAS